jgi:hypothetical protein
LFVEAARVWAGLEKELDADPGLRFEGGLMVAEKSDDPLKISPGITKVTNPPGPDKSFTDLPEVLRLLLAGQPVHFNAAGGGLNFEPRGRVTSSAYDIWQVNDDGSASIQRTIVFKG